MPSYQEIETRLAVVEEKLDFVMENMRFGSMSPITGQQVVRSLKDLYLEAKQVAKFNGTAA